MYDLGQQITERVEELEDRFEADEVNVSNYEKNVSFQVVWEDDTDDATEQLDRAKDVLENKLPPEHDPDNTEFSAHGDRFSMSIGYDYTDEDDEAEDDDEEDNETETEAEEE